jgi:hypothetical protein
VVLAEDIGSSKFTADGIADPANRKINQINLMGNKTISSDTRTQLFPKSRRNNQWLKNLS